jgi:hypothetical protein
MFSLPKPDRVFLFEVYTSEDDLAAIREIALEVPIRSSTPRTA